MRQIPRHTPRFLPLLAVVALAFVACAPSAGSVGTVAPPASNPPVSIPPASADPTPAGTPDPSAPTPSQTPDGSPTGNTTVRAYFFLGSFVDNAGLVPVLRTIPATQGVGAAAMRALLEGPIDDELGARPAMYTTIPEGTRFLGLRIEGGIATVNLSREFEAGGGTASVLGRLAQVVFTLTQFPSVSGVRFELDGEPVTVFSGEGVVLDQPVGRADYTDQLPAVFVDRPAWGAQIDGPLRIVGVANVFEATFRVKLTDADGHVLADKSVMATCGTGCWGTFDATIPYSVASPGWGTLQVYVLSAKDGAVEDLTEYPVLLVP